MSKNAHKLPPKSNTGYKGVYKSAKYAKKPYRALIRNPKHGGQVWIGTFDTAEEAAEAYDNMAWKIHGTDCYFNFLQFPNHE